MKPKYGDVYELDTNMDFSQVSLELALEKLPGRRVHAYCSVKLSANADGLIKAIDLCRLYKLELGLSSTYERDEWSLEYMNADPPEAFTCWSPGA